MDLGPHTGARLGTIGQWNSIDFYIHVTPYPLRGKGKFLAQLAGP